MATEVRRGRKPRGLSPFTKNFIHLLKEKGCSYRRAAKIAGVAPSVISGWTAGAIPYDPAALLRITDALHADFQFILTGVAASTEPNRLVELFEMDDHPPLTGLFVIEAKRLKVRKQ